MVKSKVMKALLASFLLILLLALGENIYFKRRVPLGIYIGENYAGGKTYQELDLTLHIINEELEKEKIYFCIPGEERPLVFTLGELAIQLDEEKILAGIYRLNTPFCYRQKIITYRKHLQVPLSFIMDKNKFFAVWEPLGNLRNSPPKNAQIWVTADKVNLKPHKTGKRLKLEQLPEKIGTALEAGPAFPLTIAIEQEDLFPELTISEIFNRGIIDEISAAHTYFDPAAANRAFNINRELIQAGKPGFTAETVRIFMKMKKKYTGNHWEKIIMPQRRKFLLLAPFRVTPDQKGYFPRFLGKIFLCAKDFTSRVLPLLFREKY